MMSAREIPQAPYDADSEKALIGSVLAKPQFYRRVLWIRPEYFFILTYKHIWEGFEYLTKKGEPIDVLTIASYMEDNSLVDPATDAFVDTNLRRITSLLVSSPRLENVEAYARRVFSLYQRRMLLTKCDEITLLALDPKVDPKITVSRWGEFSSQFRDPSAGTRSVSDAVLEELKYAERLFENPDLLPGVPTGYVELDKLTNGDGRGELIVIAARPGMGKTALACSTINNQVELKQRILFFSMEMPDRQIIRRLAAIRGELDLLKTANPRLFTDAEFAHYDRTMTKVGNDFSPYLTIDDRTGLSLDDMRSRAYEMMDTGGLDEIYVDYIGKMSTFGRGVDMSQIDRRIIPKNRTEQVGEFARGLKDMARDLNVPVVSLAQLNREVTSRKDKRPILSDLRESGDIEQEADKIIFLHREVVYNENTTDPCGADLFLDKHRNGPTGRVRLYFEAQQAHFLNGVRRKNDLGDSRR